MGEQFDREEILDHLRRPWLEVLADIDANAAIEEVVDVNGILNFRYCDFSVMLLFFKF